MEVRRGLLLWEDLAQEAALKQFLSGETLSKNQCLVGFSHAETLCEGVRRYAFRDKPKAGERRCEVGIFDGEDDVCKCNQAGWVADDRAVQGDDENFRVLIEGFAVSYVVSRHLKALAERTNVCINQALLTVL